MEQNLNNTPENQNPKDDYISKIGELFNKLYKYKPSKEVLLDISKKFPKSSLRELPDVIDFLDYLSKVIFIDGKALEEYDEWEIGLLFFIYFIVPRSMFLTLAITNENLQTVLKIMEDRIEFLKKLTENPVIKQELDKAEQEIQKEVQEKKE
ncbi:MAG: hypothetical protein ACPL1F_00255 [bacterium]|jgi:hypothetical protein